MANSNALYYPFSRCLDANVLKQLLLLFDTVTFLDAVDDDRHREFLFREVEHNHAGFLAYRDLGAAMPWLRSEGVVDVRSPSTLDAFYKDITADAILSDLLDKSWVAEADPRKFRLATQYYEGQPCWNVFKPKLLDNVVEALREREEFRHHLLFDGGDRYAWELSYSAGSSVGINIHLSVADQLGLAPVTDSRLHHMLMLRKLSRSFEVDRSLSGFDDFVEAVSQRAMIKIVDAILPAGRIELLSLEDVMRFREETKALRHDFVDAVTQTVTKQIDPSKPIESERVVASVTEALAERARVYGGELAGVRDRLWPRLIEGLGAPVPLLAAGTAALAASVIGGPAHVVAASILALGPLKAATEWLAERSKAGRSASPAVAYLSRIRTI